ncbi:MAG TPA: IS21 family transposase [Chloroflexota bacterium]
MKKAETIMEILAAYDLTHSYRDAAELVGCAPNTVARYVRTREAGGLRATPVQRTQLIDSFREKIEEWVDASHGRVRADVAQRKLEAMGYTGSERTTRRAVAEAKATYRAGHRRRFRPWLPEPGLWFQWDYADGPLVDGRKTWLWCAWLAWSRYRVVLPIRDKTLPTVIACIDVTLRRFGGVPTYGLSDNEKTLTLDHIARIAVRHPTMVDVGRYYGLTLASCVPADPQSKGGSEATVRISSADLVPTDANLLPDYTRFAELRIACDALCERINARPHRVTCCPPIERLAQERERLHPLPAEPYTAAFGVTRSVGANVPVIQFEGGEYSVPDDYVGQEVWVRQQDDEIVIVHVGRDGAHEIARWEPTVAGRPRHDPAHFGPLPEGPLHRTARARTPDEAAFLAIGAGAQQWLISAAAAGSARMRTKMIAAVALAKIYGPGPVDRALTVAAELGRFADEDLGRLIRHEATARPGKARRLDELRSLQTGTSAWAGFGS